MTLLLRDIVAPTLLTVWFVAVVVSNAFRVVLCRLQDQAFGQGPDELALAVRWESWHALAASVAGLAWGALPLLLPNVQPVYEFIVALVVSALAINSLGVYGGGRSMYYFFGLPVLLGQTAAFLFQPSVHAMPMLLAWLLASLVLLVYARHNRDALSKGLAGRVGLRMLQNDYNILLGAIPVGVMVSRQGIICDCNPALLRIFGYTREQLIGRSVQMLAVPENLATVAGGEDTRGLGEFTREQRVRRDGRIVDVEVRYCRLEGDDGEDGSEMVIFEDVTERLRTERELASQKDRLKHSLDALPSGLWDYDLIKEKFFFSHRFKSILGNLHDARLDTPQWSRLFFHHEAIHPEDAARVADARMGFLVSGSDFDEQYRLVSSGGELLWIHETAKALRDAKGRPQRYTGSLTDVTAVNTMQERLRTSEAFHRHLVEASNSLIWRANEKGVLTYVNDLGAREMYGYEAAEMIGQPLVRLCAPDAPDHAGVLARFQSASSATALRNAEMVHLNKYQRRVYVSINAVPVYEGPENRYVGAMGINTDITYLKKRERAFQDAVRLQRLIFDSAGEGIVMIRNGRIHRANQAFADLVGATVGDLVARVLSSWFEDPLEWEGVELQLTNFGNVIKVEQQIKRSDGKKLWVAVTGRVAGTGEEGQTYIWVFADISARKAQEEQSWYKANHDELTGLPNRRLLQDRFEQSLVRAKRESMRMGVLMLDLDGFKEINDVHGHNAGDEVLRSVAQRLTGNVRQLDTVARLGGDEFVIVLHQVASPPDAELMAARLIEQIRAPIDFAGKTLSVSSSLGIALYPEAGDSIAGLMHSADMAMYAAKAGGKDTYRIAQPGNKLSRKVNEPFEED